MLFLKTSTKSRCVTDRKRITDLVPWHITDQYDHIVECMCVYE